MRSRAGILLLCSSLAWARDPFQPAVESRCHQQVAVPEGWRLQGIVGSPLRYVAWWVSPQGKSHRLTLNATLPHSSWQITALTARSLMLSALQSCPPQHMRWVIKGGFYEMDGAHVSPAPDRAASGQQ